MADTSNVNPHTSNDMSSEEVFDLDDISLPELSSPPPKRLKTERKVSLGKGYYLGMDKFGDDVEKFQDYIQAQVLIFVGTAKMALTNEGKQVTILSLLQNLSQVVRKVIVDGEKYLYESSDTIQYVTFIFLKHVNTTFAKFLAKKTNEDRDLFSCCLKNVAQTELHRLENQFFEDDD